MRPHGPTTVRKVCSTLPPVVALGVIDKDALSWRRVHRGEGANAATSNFPEFWQSGWHAFFTGAQKQFCGPVTRGLAPRLSLVLGV